MKQVDKSRAKRPGRREVLVKLWNNNPRCHYCGCLTVLPESGKNIKGEAPSNLATRDHVFCRMDPRRHDESNPDRFYVVLACYKCNHDRNEVEQLGLPIRIRSALSRKDIRYVSNFKPAYPLTELETALI